MTKYCFALIYDSFDGTTRSYLGNGNRTATNKITCFPPCFLHKTDWCNGYQIRTWIRNRTSNLNTLFLNKFPLISADMVILFCWDPTGLQDMDCLVVFLHKKTLEVTYCCECSLCIMWPLKGTSDVEINTLLAFVVGAGRSTDLQFIVVF